MSLSEQERAPLNEHLNIESGDCIFFASVQWGQSCTILGRVRLACSDYMELHKGNTDIDLFWVKHFAFFGWDAEVQRYWAILLTYTRPVPEDVDKVLKGEISTDICAKPTTLSSTATSWEAVPSVFTRSNSKMLPSVSSDLPMQPSRSSSVTCWLHSTSRPAPWWLSLGLDRVVMLIGQCESIREVIAFPKNNRGADLMSESPVPETPNQLLDIHIQVKLPEKQLLKLSRTPDRKYTVFISRGGWLYRRPAIYLR